MADDPRPFGLVHGRLYVSVGDTNDAGRAPDRVVVSSGTALFTANIDMIVTNTPGLEAIDFPTKISAPINSGALQWGSPPTDDVPLAANVDANGKNLGWQWRVDLKGMKYIDPTTGQTVALPDKGWALDVKPYVAGYVDPVTGTNTTLSQLTAQAPVTPASSTQIAKGDPGPAPTLTTRNNTTTTDPAAAGTTFVPTGIPGQYYVDTVQLVGGGGGGGGGGTVTNINDVFPDGTGKVNLTPASIGAPTVTDVTNAQSTASNALSAATGAAAAAATAQSAANAAQATANSAVSAQSGFAPKDSPTFTGDPKAPTPATTDNDVSIATTAFVRAAIAQYAPTGSGTSTNYIVAWNATTQTWTYNGVTTTVRPSVTGPLLLISTNDVNATRPSWMAIGDSWLQHPNAVGG